MTVELTTLANGFRVVTDRIPDRGTTSVGVWVGSGARHEAVDEHGMSHLLEHMAFKGTPTRSAQDIAEAIELVGGDLNAATGLDSTSYYARVMEGDTGLAIDVLSDILLNSEFNEDELALEKEVILQEIAAAQDMPDDVVFDLVTEKAFPEHSLGRPILGTAGSVNGFSADRLRQFIGERYRPGDMVLSVSGGLDHETIVALADKKFGSMAAGKAPPSSLAEYGGGAAAGYEDFEQAHAVIGFEGKKFGGKGFVPAIMYSSLLGNGMSSRLFQQVREKRGLCYSIYAFSWGVSDTGLFGIHAATSENHLDELIRVSVDEARDLAENGPSEQELQRVKAQMQVGLHTGYESSPARAENIARHVLSFGHVKSKDERLAEVEAVTAEDIKSAGAELIFGSSASYAEVGTKLSDASANRFAQLEAQVAAG